MAGFGSSSRRARRHRAGARRPWARLTPRGRPPDPARRRALGAGPRRGGGAAGGGTRSPAPREALALVVERIRVPLARLPAALTASASCRSPTCTSGRRRAASTSPRVVARGQRARARRRGHHRRPGRRHASRELAPIRSRRSRDLRARHGVFFVTGNHEYYSGADAWVAELAPLGVRVLRNERVAIGEARRRASTSPASTTAARARFGARPRPRSRPRARRPRPARALVLLAHQPTQRRTRPPSTASASSSPGTPTAGRSSRSRFLVHLDQPFVDRPHRARRHLRSTSAAAPATGARPCASARRRRSPRSRSSRAAETSGGREAAAPTPGASVKRAGAPWSTREASSGTRSLPLARSVARAVRYADGADSAVRTRRARACAGTGSRRGCSPCR